MLSIFNIVRISIFSAVIAWTMIVLGLASHLDSILIANELTRYIPLAIFVSASTFIIIPALLIFGFIKRPSLIQQVRVELFLVGLLGFLWLILGIYTAFEPDTEVECDFDGDGDWEESYIFSTDMYHAQYRTLEAFSIFNAILLIAYFFLLLILATKEHIQFEKTVWRAGVTVYPWFNQPSSSAPVNQTLPQPITASPKFGGASIAFSGLFGKLATGGKVQEEEPMKAGGHYIIYIPPPPPPVTGRR